PLRANATKASIGGTAVYLASDYGECTTGETIMVDGGLHILGLPQPENF
ncbi:MAG: SDR family oxidoreductase, partial [Planktomarina sp.]|nr:SDR family oxidoreductase [Planktomarina sp.]